MPRHAEVVRQWNILREIERTRTGTTTPELARMTGVSTRTIRRDLNALQDAGFPLYDERDGNDVRWFLNGQPFKALSDGGLTLSELCALYLGRALLDTLAGMPFQRDVERAFAKFDGALSPRMRRFLDRLPAVIAAKPDRPKKQAKPGGTNEAETGSPGTPRSGETIARLIEATLHDRVVRMRYHSFSSERTKTYEIHPYRIVHAQGGLYLFAYVPEYEQVRTFAVERIRRLTVLEQSFERVAELEPEAFPHSLGVNRGTPERVSLEFSARVARYVVERAWHPSQHVTEQADGSIILDLEVCHDWALRSWIHGFGPHVRVRSPSALADQILDDLEEARAQYAPRMDFEIPASMFDESLQARLPLGSGRVS